MEKLRTKLFTYQVESHFKEIHRIVKKDNNPRIYFSAELFRSFKDGNTYFLVQDMPKALEIIGKNFFFDFNENLNDKILRKTELGEGISINQCYALIPKTKHNNLTAIP